MSGGTDFSLTTFSRSGKLVQIEYALNAVSNGRLSLGIKATNGVVIATDKKQASPLIDEKSVQKIEFLAENIGCTYSGMGPDFRVLYRKARKAAQKYRLMYHELMPVRTLVREVASVMQEFTQRGGVRPFGVSLLIAGYDDEGSHLYQVDPSGSYWAWKASALGKNAANAKTFLEKRYDGYEAKAPGLEDAIHIALLTLKEGFDGAIDEHSIEVGIVGDDGVFRVVPPDQLRDYLQEVE